MFLVSSSVSAIFNSAILANARMILMNMTVAPCQKAEPI